jgi:hypothetical protein
MEEAPLSNPLRYSTYYGYCFINYSSTSTENGIVAANTFLAWHSSTPQRRKLSALPSADTRKHQLVHQSILLRGQLPAAEAAVDHVLEGCARLHQRLCTFGVRPSVTAFQCVPITAGLQRGESVFHVHLVQCRLQLWGKVAQQCAENTCTRRQRRTQWIGGA